MSNIDFKRYADLIEDHLLDFLPEIDNKSNSLYESMSYSLTAGGKRLRPALLLASCELCGGSVTSAIPYACAIEYVHTYSLIHDDLPCMDDDELRRGKPTNHTVYGDAIATLAGDGLLNTAFEVMYRDMFMYMDKAGELKKRVRAAYEIAKGAGCTGMIAGQVADIEAEGKRCSAELLDYIHINKTAALITAAMLSGARLAEADTEQLTKLSDYAECLGLAFQITDDLLDIMGSPKELGKNTGADASQGKATYPAVYGLDASHEKVSELIEKGNAVIDYFGEDANPFKDLLTGVAQRTR